MVIFLLGQGSVHRVCRLSIFLTCGSTGGDDLSFCIVAAQLQTKQFKDFPLLGTLNRFREFLSLSPNSLLSPDVPSLVWTMDLGAIVSWAIW